MQTGKKISRRVPWLRKKRHAAPIGVCFEPLEPRLLLSGSWGGGLEVSSPDIQSNAHGNFAQQTVTFSENIAGFGTDALNQNQTVSGTGVLVDVLAQAPVLNAVNAADPVLDTPSTSDQAAPTAGDTPINGTESDSEMQPDMMEVARIRELVFVNENVAGYQQLIADLQGEDSNRIIEVVVLKGDRDGIEQVSEILAVRSDLAAVHFISHGTDGQILLGNSSLDSTTLQQNIAAISSWGNALTETGDILFYGCNIAAGSAGQHLLNDIARITGADVAASSDLTGNAKSGGDWVLEYENGEIETDLTFSPGAQQHWSGVLATFTVNTTVDTVDVTPGDGLAQDAAGNTSLRAAVMEANALAGADTIDLAADVYTLTLPGTDEEAATTGDLDITSELTINGMGSGATIIDGGDLDRVFHINWTGRATISGLTIQNGGNVAHGGGIRITGGGGGGRMTLDNVVICNNTASVSGGGIFNDGVITISDVEISGNTSGDTGGGLSNDEQATLTRVTISGNNATEGAGIYNSNQGNLLDLVNATISGNTATANGGGIHTAKLVNLTNVTLAFNFGGGGVFVTGGLGEVQLKNSILANNTGGNSNGALISLGNNIDSDGSALLGDPLDGVDPMLGPLADNGGQTKTHALLVGSPAVNAGIAAGAPVVDQRGISRDAIPDIGAFESQNNVIVVDTTSDAADGDTSSITGLLGDKGADGRISLREAIIVSNNTANIDGSDWILFNISGAGPHTILLTSALPAITDAVIIDGWSEPDFVGVPVIELNGTSAGGSTDGLRITSGGVTIRGLVINRFGGNGIIITGAGGNTIQGNYVGTNTAGTADLGNSLDGIRIDNSANNIIGGTTTQTRNIISGNNIHGVRIIGSASTSNTVQGNYIGVNASGSGALGNSYNGIWVAAGASNNLLGGTAPGAGNVISGNSDTGLEIQDSNSTGNRIEGNIIGLNAAGTAAIGNLDGVIIEDAHHNTIGGATSAQRNVISGNTGGLQGNGVVIFGTNAIGNLVQNNYIGTDISGSLDLGNAGSGVLISDNGDGGVFKGGASGNTIRDNVLSGNNYSGVSIANSGANNNSIFGNLIGVDASGFGALGNSVFGVVIWNGASGNRIGGTAAGEGNVIAFNNRGVLVDDNFTASMNNTIRGNSIHSNALLGIDLKNDGVTVNDLGDGDLGPNGLRNYPVITSAVVSGTDLTITGTLNTLPFLTNQIDFYWSPTGDPSGHGEGQTFIGTKTVTSDFFGNASFNVTFFGVSVPVGAVITATATDLSGNTSEFAQNVTAIKGNEAPVIDDQSFSVDENAANGMMVGTVLATDPDAGDILTYAITAGNTGSAFAIDASTGQITVNNSSALDYETIPSFSLTVEVADSGTPGLADTATITINLNNINDAPVGVPVITGTVAEDQTLTADTSGISDADGLGAFSYRWLRNGAAITGATGTTYTLTDADVGQQISVEVSYTDAQGTPETVTSAQVGPVANVNDLPVGVPVITGTVAEDQTLTADTSGISDADGLGAFSYRWLRNGAAITGATGTTYTLTDADVGQQISVEVSYTDTQGTPETVTSVQVGPVANVNDLPVGVPVITGTVAEDQTLTADTSGISDADGLGAFSYRWLRNGAAITGATGTTYTLTDADVGQQISVEVSYTDTQGTPETVTSVQVGPVANVNDLPVGVPVITGTVAEDQTLTADTSGISDADGLGAFSYRWLRNGAAITGATGTTYTLTDADVGQQISVEVSYTDTQGTPETVTSVQVGPVANVNDLPVGVPVITGTVAEDQTLTADTSGISDADGLGAFSYRWLRNGAAITGATGTTYTLTDADVGQQISVEVSYTDTQGTPETVTSVQVGPVANVNDLPVGVPVITGTVAEDQTLTADTSGISDADGLGAFSYRWLRNGAAITGATGSSYTLGDADVGQQISVQVSYTDGHGISEGPLTSAQVGPVANVNDLPAGVPVITGTVTEDQTLTADTSGISDADGLGAFSYRWLRNGAAITGATGTTYTLTDADVGQQISVEVSYTDAQGTLETLTSAQVGPVANVNDPGTVTIDNLAPAQGDTLTANVTDADGAAGAITYQWFRDGVAIGGASGKTYTIAQTDVGAVITVTADYTDDLSSVESLTSGPTAPVTNVNDPGMVSIDNLTPMEGDTLTANVSDTDGAGGTISYQWYRDGAAITGATGVSYLTVSADEGAVITVTADYTDDQGSVESLTSAGTAAVAHLNIAPTASNLNAAETYTEDIPLNLADIVIADVDSAAVTVSLTLSDPAAGSLSTGTSGVVTATYSGGVWSASGPIADVNALLAGVVFTPSANYDGSFAIGVSVNDGVAAPVTGIKIVTGTPVGDTPQVGSITTPVSVQSDLIVIDRNAADGAEVTHFRIANITNGTLYLADGITPIHDGDFITVAQGLAGVRFTPVADTLDNGSFTVESSEDGVSVAQQSGAAISVITVIPPPTSPTVNNPSASGDTAGPGPDTAPEAAEPAAEPEAAPEEDVPEAVAPPANRGPAEELVPQSRGLTHAPMPVIAQAVRYVIQMRAAGVDVRDIAERLSDNVGSSQKAAAADPGPQRADLQAGVHNLISARAYLNMVNSLDAVKKEMAGDNQLNRVYLGSAIVSSIGLSVGYVVWLIRGGLLLSSLLSSLPAWQILDPLPILARKKDDDLSEDEESLESILDRKPPEPKPKKEPADASWDAEEKKR